jgi:hypothetical protein
MKSALAVQNTLSVFAEQNENIYYPKLAPSGLGFGQALV